MSKPPHPPRPKVKTLAQQQADFTAEGSPPPGKVANTPPATSDRPNRKPGPRPQVPPVSGGKLDLEPTAPRR